MDDSGNCHMIIHFRVFAECGVLNSF